MSRPGPRTTGPGRGLRRSGLCLAELALLAALAGSAPAAGANDIVARLGGITVSATALRPGPSGTLTASLQVTTSGQSSDQLDAAIAAGGAPVAVYHRRVSVGELPDLASCDGDNPPPGVVDHWLHYGPLLVSGRSGGPSPPADATLTVQSAAPLAGRRDPGDHPVLRVRRLSHPPPACRPRLTPRRTATGVATRTTFVRREAQPAGGRIGRPVSHAIGLSASAAVQVLALGWLRSVWP